MRTCTASTLTVLFAALHLGCVANNADSPVAVLYNQQPGDGCTISSADTGAAIIRGSIDVQSPVGYLLTPVVRNFAQTTEFIDIEQRVAYLEGAVVTVSAPDVGLDTSYTTSFGAVVEPDGGSAGLLFELIPHELIAQVAPNVGDSGTLQTTTQLFGILGGGKLDTKEFPYTIDVCNGCAVNNLGSCATFVGDINNEGGRCNPLQDAPVVDCCVDEAGSLVCPAVTTAILPNVR